MAVRPANPWAFTPSLSLINVYMYAYPEPLLAVAQGFVDHASCAGPLELLLSLLAGVVVGCEHVGWGAIVVGKAAAGRQ